MSSRVAMIAAAAVCTVVTAGVQMGSAAAAPQQPPDRDVVAEKAVEAAAEHTKAMRGGEGQSFRVVDVVAGSGASHARMTRTYRKLPVLGGDAIVHLNGAEKWDGVTQSLDDALKVSVQPKLRKDGRLVIDARGSEPRLAWLVEKVGTQADGTPSIREETVDASTGKTLRSVEQVKTVRAPEEVAASQGKRKPPTTPAEAEAGEGQTLYSGTVPLNTTLNGSTYELKDPSRGNTFTSDMMNRNGGKGKLFTDDDNVWGDGTNANRQTAGADAQYGTDVTWDYYKAVHNRTGINGDGVGSSNRVHRGKNYANAFWTDQCFCMTYGDGDGVVLGPLVAMDVAAHEMTHGVTSATGNMEYKGEPGGLNEATSDIFAATVEFNTGNPADTPDYLVGEKIFLEPGRSLRYMDQPSRDGRSVDCWSETAGDLDVHYSSGIANHFFYLLSEGSGAKTIEGVEYNSPTCDGSTVTGIGIKDAEQIWYKALTTQFTTTTDYAAARTGTLAAAEELYGADSTQHKAVASAWSAVNVK